MSLATSAEEITRVGSEPSCKNTRGPYSFESFCSDTWGESPVSWCRFPISGSFQGPGGSLVAWALLVFCLINNINTNDEVVINKRRKKNWEIIAQLHSLVCSMYSVVRRKCWNGAAAHCCWFFKCGSKWNSCLIIVSFTKIANKMAVSLSLLSWSFFIRKFFRHYFYFIICTSNYYKILICILHHLYF